MRELRYFLELSDGTHREASLSFSQAESLLRDAGWRASDATDKTADGAPASPFLLFLDQGESFFMATPEPEGMRITARVLDKWNLFGLVKKDKTFTLNFGLLSPDDALALLKLFFEDNYPALRALEMQMDKRDRAE